MIRIRFKKDKYYLPDISNELPIGKYIQIKDLTEKEELTLNEKKSLFSILMDTSVTSFNGIDDEWFNVLYNNISYLTNNEKETRYLKNNYFTLNKELYMLIDLEKLTVLEYIDLTLLLLQKEDKVVNNMEEILNILIRKVTNRPKKSLYKYIINKVANKYNDANKEYKFYIESDILEHTNYVNNIGKIENNIWNYLPYTVALEIIKVTLTYLYSIIAQYPLVYGMADDKMQAEQYNRDKHKESYSIYKEKDEDKTKSNPYGLYASLSNICDDDKIKIDYWLKKPFKELLSHFTYIIYKNN